MERLDIILLLKTKPRFKFILAKILYLNTILELFLESNFYYFHNKHLITGLNFIFENRFLLLLFVVILIGLAMFYLFVKTHKAQTIKVLCKIKVRLVEVENNCVLGNRNTQVKIINYFNLAG